MQATLSQTNAHLQSTDNFKNRVSTHITERRIEWINEIIRFACEYLTALESIINSCLHTPDNENIGKIKYFTNQIKIRLCYENDIDDAFIKQMYSINYLIEVAAVFKCELGIGYTPTSLINTDISYIRKEQLKYIELHYGQLIGLTDLPVVNNEGDDRICSIYNIILTDLYKRVQSYQDVLVIRFEKHIMAEWSRVKYEINNGTTDGFSFQKVLNKL